MDAARVDLSDIQGLLVSGYGRQRAMGCLLFQINDRVRTRDWLRRQLHHSTFCGDKDTESKRNLAFTFKALQLLLDDDALYGFSPEFCEGMVTPHRQRILGDLPSSASDPEKWNWGGAQNKPIHILLLLYEMSTAALKQRIEQEIDQLEGIELIASLQSTWLKDSKEHFGFRDDIGQPWVRELHKPAYERDRVALGEFVLGYDDNSGEKEPAPDIAVNGTYLVMRQIVQRVAEFWGSFPTASDEDKVWQASKLVGRWPDGTPLTLSPDRPDANKPFNDFDFAPTDAAGDRCPLGAHIRRANPRDALLPDPTQSRQEVNRHRILRRGRPFGSPASESAYPRGIVVAAEDDVAGERDERGILFMCLNASLSRQFEFCQHSWLNNPKFDRLSTDTDAIGCQVQWSGVDQKPTLTTQASPVRIRREERDKYIHTIGGAYFFLPSRTLLKKLSCE